MDRQAFPRQRCKYPRKQWPERLVAYMEDGENSWVTQVGRGSWLMILKKAAAELECLHALHVNTYLLRL